MNIELAWINENGALRYVGDGTETLIGWTPDEAMMMPISSLIAPRSIQYLKEHYYVGPRSTIVPHSFPIRLLHKDGHEVCCYLSVVCQYNGKGALSEAWGSIRCCQEQCLQNALLEWWPMAKKEELRMMEHLLEVCAT